MKFEKRFSLSAMLGTLLISSTVFASQDFDLHLNGHFRGQARGTSPAHGWTLTADGGNAKVLPAKDPGEFKLELTAGKRSQSVVSELHPVFGNMVEIKADLSGRGTAVIGYEAFDQSKTRIVASDKQECALNGILPEQKFKKCFTISVPAAYIRVRLTAAPGSAVIFRDVDAEMKTAPASIAAPQPGTAAKPCPAPAASNGKILVDDQYLSWSSLSSVEYFQVQLPAGSDIDFDLQEYRDENLYWNVISYDARICRIKVDHDRGGIFPFRHDKAEFKINALGRGTTDIVLVCGEKKVIIRFSAL